ncbi:MAG TPA: M42 family metallopeptidase [Terriglobia bacterium]|nr:M42 family metallopeptidase [Terriglobia bacterium]
MRRVMILGGLVILTISAGLGLLAQGGAKDDRVVQLMEEYTNAPAPPGDEGAVRDLVLRDLHSAGAEVSIDGMGSVIGVVRGTSDRPRIMVDAHMDEVGLMVQYIRPEGFIAFKTLGYPDPWLVDKRWVILTHKGAVFALTGARDVHVWPAEERPRGVPREEIVLDVGATSKEEAEQLGIRPGDFIAPVSPFTVMARERYAAKAWDDRVGLLVMVEALRKLKATGAKLPNSIYFVATTQEELGMRGAHVAVETVKPDLGIALEPGIAGDVPGVSPDRAQERLGSGPAIFLFDNSMLPNRKLVELFQHVAKDKQIPLQTEVLSGGYREDGSEIQSYGTGRPSILLTVPARYTHAHTSVIDRHDFDGAVDLLTEILTRLDAGTVEEISRF